MYIRGSVISVFMLSVLLIGMIKIADSSNNTPAKSSPTDTIHVSKKTLAEMWYKTGGHWEDGKYIGGSEFKKFSSLHVPDECTDHSFFMKYEGPGWESDKVGYRLYLDWRNAIDIFGKKVDTLVLPGVGQDGYDSYHEMAPWGMDVLKVGESLGIGSLGYWDGQKAQRVAVTDSVFCKINDGDLRSEVLVDYFGWKINNKSIDLNTSLAIEAGSRATLYSIVLSEDLDNLCTGIVKLEGAEFIQGKHDGNWSYIATWGNQSLAGDSLGLAVLFRSDRLLEMTEDGQSHVVVLKPVTKQVDYYLLAAWAQEPGGIKTKKCFLAYLDGLLENPDKTE